MRLPERLMGNAVTGHLDFRFNTNKNLHFFFSITNIQGSLH